MVDVKIKKFKKKRKEKKEEYSASGPGNEHVLTIKKLLPLRDSAIDGIGHANLKVQKSRPI